MAAVADTSLRPRASGVRLDHRVLGAASLGLALAHLVMLAAITHSPAWSVALAAMTIWCLKCSWCVLRGGSALSLMAMCALMAMAHVAMVVGMPWFSGHHSVHEHSGGQHAALMLWLAAAELALMFGAALVVRGRNRRTCGRHHRPANA